MRNLYNDEECLSWNCCDENLQLCIERSKFVKEIRSKLKKRKFRITKDKY